MVWGLKAPVWFGIALAGLALFLWCLLGMIEQEATSAGYMWGIIVFGIVGIFAGILAIISQSNAGGVTRAKDRLTKGTSPAPRSSSSQRLMGSGHVPMGDGGVPHAVSGRSIT